MRRPPRSSPPLEPLVTVLLAFLVFGEMLSAVQLAGGAVMLAALLVLAASPQRNRRPRHA